MYGVQMVGCMFVLHVVCCHRGGCLCTYRKLTSKVASIVSLIICIDSMNSTKVSLMYEDSCLPAGWRYVSRYLEMFSVIELQVLTMGLSDICVFSLGSIGVVLMFWIRVVVGSMFRYM